MRIFVDYNELDPVHFFRLGDFLSDIINLKLGRRKRHHHWGGLRLHLRGKIWLRLLAGEIIPRDEIGWRPITSFRQRAYRNWLSFAGKVLTILAYAMFPLGDTVASVAESYHADVIVKSTMIPSCYCQPLYISNDFGDLVPRPRRDTEQH